MEDKPGIRRVRVVGALIRRDGRILLTQRLPDRSQPLRWEFPGGKVHDGEQDAEALVRELHEELGVTAVPMDHYLTVEHDYPDFRITLAVYACDIDGQTPRCLEVADLAWVLPESLLAFDLTPPDVPVAEQLGREAGRAATEGSSPARNA